LLKVLAQPITVEIFWKIGDSVTFDIQLKLFFSEKIQMFFTKCGDQLSIADCGSVAFHKRLLQTWAPAGWCKTGICPP